MKKILIGLAIVAVTLVGMNCAVKAQEIQSPYTFGGLFCKSMDSLLKVRYLVLEKKVERAVALAEVNKDSEDCNALTTSSYIFLKVKLVKETGDGKTKRYFYVGDAVGFQQRSPPFIAPNGLPMVQIITKRLDPPFTCYFASGEPLNKEDIGEPA